MIDPLNRTIDAIERDLGEEIDVATLAATAGTTEYHLRRMFSSLAGMPLSEYIRRRRMTVAAADVVGGAEILATAVRYGYGSTEGSELTYLHGVAVGAGDAVPVDLDAIDVPAGAWVVFRVSGPYPETLQSTWAATATEWFPSNPWRLRPGPSIVAILERSDDFRTATCELWLPVERG